MYLRGNLGLINILFFGIISHEVQANYSTFCELQWCCTGRHRVDLALYTPSGSTMRCLSDHSVLPSHVTGRLRSSNLRCVWPGTFQYTWSPRSYASPPYGLSLMVRSGELPPSMTLYRFRNQHAFRTTHRTIGSVMLNRERTNDLVQVSVIRILR